MPLLPPPPAAAATARFFSELGFRFHLSPPVPPLSLFQFSLPLRLLTSLPRLPPSPTIAASKLPHILSASGNAVNSRRHRRKQPFKLPHILSEIEPLAFFPRKPQPRPELHAQCESDLLYYYFSDIIGLELGKLSPSVASRFGILPTAQQSRRRRKCLLDPL